MTTVIVFDLDDTLYEELTYVKSGFCAVAEYLHETYQIDPQESLSIMLKKLTGGRGSIFDSVLKEFDIYTYKNVRKCVSVYRGHTPNITLSKDTEACLARLAAYHPIYIVTDGNKLVQKKKLITLGLYERVKFCFITYRYGLKHSKPSPYCFRKICEREKVTPSSVVYIGDNPYKDFVGIKPLGFKTIRILRGHFKDVKLSRKYEAEHQIYSLEELGKEYIRRVLTNV